MRHKVLFLTKRSPLHQRAVLETAPPECEVTMLRDAGRARVLEEIADAEFLISERSGAVDRAMIEAARRLRLIQRLGSLAYDIDTDAAREFGIAVCIQPVRDALLVAEHMVMQMLALAKRLPEVSEIAKAAGDWGLPSRRTDENTFAYNWSRRTGIGGIVGQTVGIWGFGEIGAELARRLIAFRPAQVLYYRRNRMPEATERELGLRYAKPEELLSASDFLCVLLPYSSETELSINADSFARMKRGAFVVHCGSGSVIDEAALAQALRAGQIGGAALDTFEWEPLRPDNPLVALAREPEANVLLTPHTAAGTGGSRADDWENVRRMLAGQPLLNRIA